MVDFQRNQLKSHFYLTMELNSLVNMLLKPGVGLYLKFNLPKHFEHFAFAN